MGMYGDPEGTFTSVRTAATPVDTTSYRAIPQFAVSLTKLAVMSLVTFGIYELYWSYKQWDAQRRRDTEDMMPFWRAVFAPLWAFSLFPRLQRLSDTHGVGVAWSGTALAVAYLVLHVTYRLPDPYWLIA